MAVEKAITFDDLQKGDDDERREGFFGGGQGRSRRGGMRGGRRGGTTRGGRRGGRSARGASMRGAKARAAKASRAKSSKQGVSRKGTTTTSKAVSRAVADKQNKMGTKYSGKLAGAIARANARHRARSLAGRKEAAAKAAIQSSEAKQVSPTQSSIDAQVSKMDAARGGLLDKAKRNQISTAELSRLADMNRAIGLNPTTGMGFGESMRFNTKDVNLGDIAKLAGFVANPGLAIATGGKGILGLLGNLKEGVGTALGFGESPQQMVSNPNLREGTMATQKPGFLSGIASALRLGEGPGFTEERGGGRGREPLLPITPPVPPTTGGLFGKIPAGIPIKKAVTPVGTAVTEDAINEYLRLAGFNI